MALMGVSLQLPPGFFSLLGLETVGKVGKSPHNPVKPGHAHTGTRL